MTNDNNALLHSGFLLADLVFFHKGQNGSAFIEAREKYIIIQSRQTDTFLRWAGVILNNSKMKWVWKTKKDKLCKAMCIYIGKTNVYKQCVLYQRYKIRFVMQC